MKNDQKRKKGGIRVETNTIGSSKLATGLGISDI